MPRQASRGISRRCAGFFRFGQREGWTKTNPAKPLRNPRKGRSLPHFLSAEDLGKLFDAPPPTARWACAIGQSSKRCTRPGLRVSEVVGLDDADLDFEAASSESAARGDESVWRRSALMPFGDRTLVERENENHLQESKFRSKRRGCRGAEDSGKKRRLQGIQWGRHSVCRANGQFRQTRMSAPLWWKIRVIAKSNPCLSINTGGASRREASPECWKSISNSPAWTAAPRRTRFGTVSPRICWTAAPISAACRNCSATRAFRPHKSTRTSALQPCAKCTSGASAGEGKLRQIGLLSLW